MAAAPPITSTTEVTFRLGRYYVGGQVVDWEDIPEDEREEYLRRLQDAQRATSSADTSSTPITSAYRGAGFPRVSPPVPDTPQETEVSSVATVEAQGTAASTASARLRDLLISYGADPDNPQTQAFLATVGTNDVERLAAIQENPSLTAMLGTPGAPTALPVSSYDAILAASGFDHAPYPTPARRSPVLFDALGETPRMVKAEPEYSEETGYQIFGDGTIVTDQGQIVYDPSQSAPGSPQWLRMAAQTWDTAEISQWRDRLVDMGYLPREAKKTNGFDIVLGQALQQYHANRYINGGKPIALDASGDAGGRFAGQPLFNYAEISNQIHNDVTEQFRAVYGTDPEPAEVRAWTQFVISKGMDLQRRFRAQEIGSYQSAGLGESLETFRRQLEDDAAPFREAIEENTTLRDGLSSAISAIGSL